MPSKQELEATAAPLLAARCRKIGADTSVDSAIRDEATKLATEWMRLQKPPNPDLKAQRKIEAEQAAQKARMVDFLIMFSGVESGAWNPKQGLTKPLSRNPQNHRAT
jgi:hypothetical protein